MSEQPPSGRAIALPPRPPGSRILVVHDDAGLTIVIPPRFGCGAASMLAFGGACCLLALLFLGLTVVSAFQGSPFTGKPDLAFPVFNAVCQSLLGVSLMLQA